VMFVLGCCHVLPSGQIPSSGSFSDVCSKGICGHFG